MRDGNRNSMAMSASIIHGSIYSQKKDIMNSMRIRKKIAMSLRIAVSFLRVRIMHHLHHMRMSVLGLHSKLESLLNTAEINSSIFGRDSFLLELRRYGRMDKNKQGDCKSLAMAGRRKAEMVD